MCKTDLMLNRKIWTEKARENFFIIDPQNKPSFLRYI